MYDEDLKKFHPSDENPTYVILDKQGKITSTVSLIIDDYIDGGLMALYHNDKPIGIVRGSHDKYEDAPIMNIRPLAIIPKYQGMGLGRSLLRASLQCAGRKGYKKTILCVNGENEKAKTMYMQEGFKEVESVVCYKYDLTPSDITF